jgi:hypothetical protein
LYLYGHIPHFNSFCGKDCLYRTPFSYLKVTKEVFHM